MPVKRIYVFFGRFSAAATGARFIAADWRRAAGEWAEVPGAVAGYGEVAAKAGFLHHGCRVAADQHGLARLEYVVVVQNEAVR